MNTFEPDDDLTDELIEVLDEIARRADKIGPIEIGEETYEGLELGLLIKDIGRRLSLIPQLYETLQQFEDLLEKSDLR